MPKLDESTVQELEKILKEYSDIDFIYKVSQPNNERLKIQSINIYINENRYTINSVNKLHYMLAYKNHLDMVDSLREVVLITLKDSLYSELVNHYPEEVL